MSGDTWTLAGRTYESRLLLGTGKYPDLPTMRACHEVSGTQIVTVALRRVDFSAKETVLDFIDRSKITLLPNTAGCFSADEAVNVCLLARDMGLGDLVKLEVIGDKTTLMPDMVDTLKATETLAQQGFKVMAYTTDDPVANRRIAEAGATAVMPIGSPIGSGLGILNPTNIRMVIEAVRPTGIPVLVDAGVGTASDVAVAMELGVEAVLLNTAVAQSCDPVQMAEAMRLACDAGRLAWRAGRMERRPMGQASTPPRDFALSGSPTTKSSS